MDSHTASTTIEPQQRKRPRRKTRLEKLAEAEQRLAAAQAEVDRLKAEEEKIDAGMKIRFASWIIDAMHGAMKDDESDVPALIALIEVTEEASGQKIAKDLFAWIKTKA